MNFCVARARSRARGSGVVFVVAPVGSAAEGGGDRRGSGSVL